MLVLLSHTHVHRTRIRTHICARHAHAQEAATAMKEMWKQTEEQFLQERKKCQHAESLIAGAKQAQRTAEVRAREHVAKAEERAIRGEEEWAQEVHELRQRLIDTQQELHGEREERVAAVQRVREQAQVGAMTTMMKRDATRTCSHFLPPSLFLFPPPPLTFFSTRTRTHTRTHLALTFALA